LSTEDLIKKGLIAEKKQEAMQLAIDGKASLQALVNEAVMAKARPLKDVNVDAIMSYAQTLRVKKYDLMRLLDEIKELE